MSHPLLPNNLPPFQLDDALTLVQVAQRVRAPQGGRLNVAVAWRWATRGYTCRIYAGPALILPTVMVGKRRYTMPAWLELFEAARVRMGTRIEQTKQRTDRQASAAHRRAVDRLKKSGINVGAV